MSFFDIFKRKKVQAQETTPLAHEDNEEEVYRAVAEEIRRETLIDTVSITLVNSKPSIFDSKAGGIPYIPHDAQLPRDSFNRQLCLLVQIDCAKLYNLTDFPHSGLLQFFIAPDDICGLEDEKGYAVIYHENVDMTVTEDECKSKIETVSEDFTDCFPVMGEFGMEFKAEKMPMTESDYRFERILFEKLNSRLTNCVDTGDWIDTFRDMLGDGGHRAGGYPIFTQYDPRDENDDRSVLLLQLDSDFSNGCDRVMWGDCGVGNFFINRDDLKKRDFSKVLYNWDCC